MSIRGTRAIASVATLALALCVTACGGAASTSGSASAGGSQAAADATEQAAPREISAGEALEALRAANAHVTDVLVWDEATDPNGNLGRPGQYVSKADFSDDRVAETWASEEDRLKHGLEAGTIETFSSESDCAKRCEYLRKFMGANAGVLGLKQYMYRYPKALFRVSYDIVPSEAEVYKAQMDEIMGITSEAIVAEE